MAEQGQPGRKLVCGFQSVRILMTECLDRSHRHKERILPWFRIRSTWKFGTRASASAASVSLEDAMITYNVEESRRLPRNMNQQRLQGPPWSEVSTQRRCDRFSTCLAINVEATGGTADPRSRKPSAKPISASDRTRIGNLWPATELRFAMVLFSPDNHRKSPG